MAFEVKTWKNRESEYPGRRTLTPTGTENEYDVVRSEGLVTEEGDPFDQNSMNDLENRILELDEALTTQIVGANNTAITAQTTAKNAQTTADNAMPKTGGTFTGDVRSAMVDRGYNSFPLRGILVQNSAQVGVNTDRILFRRK